MNLSDSSESVRRMFRTTASATTRMVPQSVVMTISNCQTLAQLCENDLRKIITTDQLRVVMLAGAALPMPSGLNKTAQRNHRRLVPLSIALEKQQGGYFELESQLTFCFRYFFPEHAVKLPCFNFCIAQLVLIFLSQAFHRFSTGSVENLRHESRGLY
jgi:hypothetical protein